MKKKFSFWGTIIIFVLAMALHSLFDITSLEIFKPISPVNESVWEHMKMMFFAGFLYYLLNIVFSRGQNFKNLAGYAVSLIVMPLVIPMLVYTYTSIVGTNILAVDIVIAFIAALTGEYIAFRLRPKHPYRHNRITIFLSAVIIALLAFMFVYFTYNPLGTPIFLE